MGIGLSLLLTACSDAHNSPLTPTETNAYEEQTSMKSNYDFSVFNNVKITGIDIPSLNDAEQSVLFQQARYCQAMTDADMETMNEIISDNMVFTHMSGKQQTKAEYLGDIQNGSLKYFTIGIENPTVKVHGNAATVTFTSVLNANAYGARGTYRMSGTHHYEKHDNNWIAVNG